MNKSEYDRRVDLALDEATHAAAEALEKHLDITLGEEERCAINDYLTTFVTDRVAADTLTNECAGLP